MHTMHFETRTKRRNLKFPNNLKYNSVIRDLEKANRSILCAVQGPDRSACCGAQVNKQIYKDIGLNVYFMEWWTDAVCCAAGMCKERPNFIKFLPQLKWNWNLLPIALTLLSEYANIGNGNKDYVALYVAKVPRAIWGFVSGPIKCIWGRPPPTPLFNSLRGSIQGVCACVCFEEFFIRSLNGDWVINYFCKLRRNGG